MIQWKWQGPFPLYLLRRNKQHFSSLYANLHFKVHKMHNTVTPCTLLLWNANDGWGSSSLSACESKGGSVCGSVYLVCIALPLTLWHLKLSFVPFAPICHKHTNPNLRDTHTHTQPLALSHIYLDVLGRWAPLQSLLFIYQVIDSAAPWLLHLYISHTHTRTHAFITAVT